MQWGTPPSGGFNLPHLNLVGYSLSVRIQSVSGGNLLVLFGQSPSNLLEFSTTFAGSSGYQNVLIPFTNPTIFGTGSNLGDVTQILLDVATTAPGGTFSINSVQAIAPEPSTLLLLGIGLVGMVTRSSWRRSRP